MKSWRAIRQIAPMCVLALLLAAAACRPGNRVLHGESAYVAASQVNLRDRLSAVYNKVAVVKNGERVEILEKSRRFLRVRSPRGEEGWVEARYLVGPEVFDALAKLANQNINTPVQARGVTRAELKMHLTPGRDADSLYRVPESAKLELLKRAIAEKPQPKLLSASESGEKEQPPAPTLEDWWLARDVERHTGWVLARMIDLDIPMEIAQYAEGQRIMAAFVLNQVTDINPQNRVPRQVPQYLTVVNDAKEGTHWDYNQLRVFTWNAKRHRYETAYRERNLYGFFPVTIGHEVFDKEGDLPTFTIRVQDPDGNVADRKYKLNQPIVRRVLSPGEQQKLEESRRTRSTAKRSRVSRRAAATAEPAAPKKLR